MEKAYIERRRSEGFIFLYYDDTHILFLPLLFELFVSLIIIINIWRQSGIIFIGLLRRWKFVSLFTVGKNEYETEHAICSVSNEVRSFVHFTFYYRYYLYPLFCFQYITE